MTKIKLLIAFGLIYSCAFAIPENLSHEYNEAIAKSSLHTLSSSKLLSVSKDQKPLIMVTWSNKDFEKGQQTLNKDVWVTNEKEMQNICKSFPKNTLPLNISQLLGMPAQEDYSKWHFTVIQVANEQATPTDNGYFSSGIYRPCENTYSIYNTSSCEYTPSSNNTYNTWVLNTTINNYKYDSGYPWTGLGYTYNWNPESNSIIGLSEFIISKGTSVDIIKESVEPSELCD